MSDPSKALPSTPLPILDLPLHDQPPTTNKRVLPRVAKPFQVRRGNDMWRGVNLSAKGMLCSAKEPVWPGNAVHLELQLGEARLEVEGEVCDLVALPDTVGMRVRFVSLRGPQLERIMQWVAEGSHH